MTLSPMTDAAAPILISLALRSAAVLAGAWGLTMLMRRASAAARHLTWVIAIVAVLVVPALSALPGWHVLPRWEPATWALPRVESQATNASATAQPDVAPPAAPSSSTAAGTPVDVSTSSPLSLASTLIMIWIAGAALALLPPVVGRILLRLAERRCEPMTDGPAARILAQAAAGLGVGRPIVLLRGETNAMPMAWGVFRPRILLPRECSTWPSAQLCTVLLHELAHIRRHDCLTHLLAQVARALYWPNPLAWIAARALHAERERACDDLVLGLGDRATPTDYAAQLLTIASGRRLPPASAAAMAMARPSQLEHRMRSILDTTRSRRTMTRTHRAVAATLAAGLLVPVVGLRSAIAQPQSDHAIGWDEAQRCASHTLRYLGQAIIGYTVKHDQVLPPDLGATMDFMTADPDAGGAPPSKARGYLCPSDTRAIPETVTPDWINANSSFVYIAGGVKWTDLPDPSWIAIAYERDGHMAAPPNGQPHKLFSTLLANCSVAPFTADKLNDVLALSKATFEAIRNGAALPDIQQAAFDLTLVSHAIAAYTKSHAGQLPPDLGATLSYIQTTPRTSTPAQKARAYLLPAAQRTAQIPDDPTPEWINANTSYVYLGRPGLDLPRIPDPQNVMLVHGPLDQPVSAGTSMAPLIPTASTNDRYRLLDQPFGTRLIPHSKQVLNAVATGGPLPDYEHAWRDLTILIDAIERYAADHKGELPPDLGATILYLNPALLAADTPIERARVYLSPAAERTSPLPDALTPDWVNQHATYIYLGGRDITLADVGRSTEYALLHTNPDEPITWVFNNDEPATMLACAFGTKSMVLSYGDRDFAVKQIATARKKIDELRAKSK
jgi:beta-lactamase regulating signal transducer with metallopeptidase domain